MSETLKEIKSGLFSRFLSLAEMTVSTGARVMAYEIGTALDELDAREVKWASS